MEFEQAVTLLSIAGLIVATFLIHRSVPASMWDKGVTELKSASAKTKTPVDDMLVELLVLLRGMQQAEPKPADTPELVIPNGATTTTVTTTTQPPYINPADITVG